VDIRKETKIVIKNPEPVNFFAQKDENTELNKIDQRITNGMITINF